MPLSDITPPPKKEKPIKEKIPEKEIKERKRYFEKSSKSQKVKRFLEIIGIFLVVLVVLYFTGIGSEISRMVFGGKKFKRSFYSFRCGGEWQNPENVQGLPEVLSDGDLSYFSNKNSAVYEVGSQNLFCEDFEEVLDKDGTEEEKKMIELCGKGNKNCSLKSAKVYFSLAIDEKLALNDLYRMARDKEIGKSSVKIEDEEHPEEAADIDSKIAIWYSTDNGETWHLLKKVTTLPLSNYLNGDYISLQLEELEGWEDLENLRIRFEGVMGGDEKNIVFLDSTWVEVEAEQEAVPKETTKESPKEIFSMFKEGEVVSPEETKVITKESEYQVPSDGRIIAKVTNSDETVDGIFYIKFFSEDDKLVSTLIISSGDLVGSIGDYDVPSLKAKKIKQSLLKSKKGNEMDLDIKKEWGNMTIKVDYIPLAGRKETGSENLNLAFEPELISTKNSKVLGEEKFGPKEKTEKEFDLENKKEGIIIINTLEVGGGSGAYLIFLDEVAIGIVEIINKNGRVALRNILPGKHKLKIRHVDSNWEDNKGERTIKVYFRESDETKETDQSESSN